MTAEAARRRSIYQGILLGIGLLILVLVSATSIYLVNKAREDAGWVVHTVEVENQIFIVLLDVRRAESAERGYVITGVQDYVDDFNDALKGIDPNLKHLRDLVADNPVQVKNADNLSALVADRVVQFHQVIGAAQQHSTQEGMDAVRASNPRDLMNQIRSAATEMRAEEDRLFKIRTASADQSQTLAAIVTIAGSALVLILGLVSVILVRISARARDEAEEKLRENNLNLESTVQARTADLQEANEEIQRFAYIVSHDLRSPLVNIMGFTSELDELRGDIFNRIGQLSNKAKAILGPVESDGAGLDDQDRQLSADFSEALGFIKSSIAKMDRLISAILNLTREGRRQFKPERVEMRGLIENIAGTVAHQLAEANAKISIETLPDIVSDRLALEQIFSNLIDNAVKYLKPGVAGSITVRGRRKLRFAVYEVSDNGRGIDPKDHTRIFDLFRRAGTQDKPGQGIGLAHVRALVRRMGGTLSVNSELGTGSTFVVMLPINWTLNKEQSE